MVFLNINSHWCHDHLLSIPCIPSWVKSVWCPGLSLEVDTEERREAFGDLAAADTACGKAERIAANGVHRLAVDIEKDHFA